MLQWKWIKGAFFISLSILFWLLFWGALRAFMFPKQHQHSIHLNVNAKKLIKIFKIVHFPKCHIEYEAGFMNPPQKKGGKKKLTPHHPIGSHQN
jgi:hypothetical protein